MPSFKSVLVSSAVAMVATLPLGSVAVPAHNARNVVDGTTCPFQAPVPGDSRSPCPGLNSLANHGILPRDGKNIDMATLKAAAFRGFSLDEAATEAVGGVALQASTTGDATTFNLADLAQHSPQIIEHDGSMTREDAHFGNNLVFSQAAYDRTLANWGTAEILDYALAASERNARFAYGVANNPVFNATFANSGSLLELCLIMSAFGSVTEGNGNLTLIKYMFENERLPFELGWVPPTTNITATTVQAMAAAVAALL